MCSVKAPTVVPSSSVNPLGALTRHVTMTVTPVIGEPPSGKRVALNVSWPPSTPGFGPPKRTKLVNPVAAQVPLATTLPAALNWVNEPFATMPPAWKLPAPVVLIVSPVPGSTAVLGFCSTKPAGSLEMAAAGDRSEEHTSELQSHVNLVCRLLLEKKNRGSQPLGLGRPRHRPGARYRDQRLRHPPRPDPRPPGQPPGGPHRRPRRAAGAARRRRPR